MNLLQIAIYLLLGWFSVVFNTYGQGEYLKDSIPPNGVEIGSDLFFDKAEVCNLNWLEFEYRPRPFLSEEDYDSTLVHLAENFWSKILPCTKDIEDQYLRFPGRRLMPLIGVSQAQAKLYTKWRQNVVFYLMLERQKLIKPPKNWQSKPDKYPSFTVESYFDGTYPYIVKRKPKAKRYIQFRLPTQEEYEMAIEKNKNFFAGSHLDSLSDGCIELIKGIEENGYGVSEPCDVFPPVALAYIRLCDSDFILHLRGNVSEWLIDDDMVIGGSWVHEKEISMNSLLVRKGTPNAFTGFRNVAEWVEWKKDEN